MIIRYVGKTFIRNKQRTFFLTIGIIICVTLIVGINSASEVMGRDMIEKNISDVYTEFTLTTSEENSTIILNNLQGLNEEIEDYLGSYYNEYNARYRTVLSPNSSNIDWGSYNFSTGDDFIEEDHNYLYKEFNTSHLCGFLGDIYSASNETIKERFENLISFGNNPFNHSQDGLYIESTLASQLNIQKGDYISFGEYYDEYNWQTMITKNITAEINNIPILGIFNIFNKESFHKLVQNQEWAYFNPSDILIIGNANYIRSINQNLSNQLDNKAQIIGIDYYDHYYPNNFYGIMIDQKSLPIMSVDALNEYITQTITRIQLHGQDYGYRVRSPISNKLDTIRGYLIIYNVIFVAVSIPVIVLGWFLTKTSYYLSYQQRRREIALLKCKGAFSNQLKRVFYGESILIGVIGGVIGTIFGNLSSRLILDRISPESVETMPLFPSISPDTWLIGIIIGLLVSLLAVIVPLKNFIKMHPMDGIQQYHEDSQTILPRKKIDIAMFVLSIIIISFAYLTRGAFSGGGPVIMSSYLVYNPLLGVLVGVVTSLLPIAPFIIVYSSVKLICSSKTIFEKVIRKISKIFGDKYSTLSSRNIIQNQTRSFRLVFIVAVSLSFLIMATSAERTEAIYQEDLNYVIKANGIPLSYYTWNKDINLNNVIEALESAPSINDSIEEYGWGFTYAGSGIKGYNDGDDWGIGYNDMAYYDEDDGSSYLSASAVMYGISLDIIEKNLNFRDKWFPDNKAEEILDKLKTIPNSTVMPETMLSEGYKVGDKISFEYQLINGSKSEINLNVVGTYSVFPIVSLEMYQQSFIISNETVVNGVLNRLNLIAYPKDGISSNNITFDDIQEIILEYDNNGYCYNPIGYYSEFSAILSSTLKFLDLETYYLLTIAVFAIGFIMFISITEKSRDFGVLRARGVPKKEIYKIQLIEGSILLVFASIIGLVGIIGADALIMNINQFDFFSFVSRTLVIPWLKILWQVLLLVVLYLAAIAISVHYQSKNSDVGKISDLLRV